jgi:hypothetical protein
VVAFSPFAPEPVNAGDVLALRVSARVGTLPSGAKCSGHNSATGLRLYYGSTGRSSQVAETISPNPSVALYLNSDGAACTSAQSANVTTRTLGETAPTATAAKCKDSGSINFTGGNPFSVIGTWSQVAH